MELQKNINGFQDLKFRQHPNDISGTIAQCEFENGYGLSIVNGDYAYCTEGTYEVAILHNGEITYNTPLTDDVLIDVSPSEINTLIKVVKSFNKD